MDISEYQKQVAAGMIAQSDERHLLNAALGLADEAGKVAHVVKQVEFLGRARDAATDEELTKKLGDAAWYLAQAATALGIDLANVLAANLRRVAGGYPSKPGN